jgi:hypothetical protein
LSFSRLGYTANAAIADEIYRALEERRLVRSSEDGMSIPMHHLVRSLVLVLLAQILRSRGREEGLELLPATDVPLIHAALQDFLEIPSPISAGHVVSLDVNTVGLDLSAVPIDEVLDYRKENAASYRSYMRSIRQLVRLMQGLSDEDQQSALRDRREEISDMASSLQKSVPKTWRKRAAFGLQLVGAGVRAHSGDVPGAALATAATVASADLSMSSDVGAYSYLFGAARRFPSRSGRSWRNLFSY